METQETSINFLDLTITKENTNHTFKVFRKPNQSDLIIPANSNSPWQHKMATFHSLIDRLLRVPMSVVDYNNEKRIIKFLATNNGYRENLIDKMIKKKKKKLQQPNQSDSNKKEYLCVPYSATLNKGIRNTFKRTNFKLSYRTRNNAFKIISKYSNPKTNNSDKFERSGIYKINCTDCDKFYIGQTGRTFKKRYSEHIQAIKSNNKTTQKSSFAEHILENNHSYKNIEDNLTILSFENKSTKLNVKEEYYIYKSNLEEKQNLLNSMQVEKKNSIFEKIINIKHSFNPAK